MVDETRPAVRRERDLIGEKEIPADALWGIHTARAQENFGLAERPVNRALVRAYGAVKLACARTNRALGYLEPVPGAALESACRELRAGQLDEHVVVDALQGGAGTSTNMNVNEVLANRALQIMGREPGDYELLGPLKHANLHQSTNDTYPTALRVAALDRLEDLETAVVALMEAFQDKERELADVVKLGRTQLQDAVLVTLGREMGAYAEAFSRDRWRVFKCKERLRVVNLGGTAVGTGLGAPRQYIFRIVDELRDATGHTVARAENLFEATQNHDALVEVSGILKALATNLMKVANDLRLMASGPNGGFDELRLPRRQAGSSMMPGKVNPVIPEAVVQAALAVMANDHVVGIAVSLGNLELNAFLPLVADRLLESLDLLERACVMLRERCVLGIEANRERCRRQVENATASVTALIESVGYEKAQAWIEGARESGRTLREEAAANGLDPGQFDELTSPERVNRLGSPGRKRRKRRQA